MQIFAQTDQGKVRNNNEDFLSHDVEHGIAVLADGMGGLNAGEVASEVAVDTAMKVLEAGVQQMGELDYRQMLTEALATANRAVYELSTTRYDYHGMGTTLIVAALHDDTCFVGHVGDSRIYWFHAGELRQIGQDHSIVQQLVNEGLLSPERARHAPNRNIITRAVGINEQVESELNEFKVVAGDLVLLCSDGLSDMVDDPIIRQACRNLAAEPERLPAELIRLANDSGGVDNISVLVIVA